MTGSERLIFIGYLLQGALCSTWSAWMPQTIQALNGSCVEIPCTFQMPSKENNRLINPVGKWSAKMETDTEIVLNSKKQRELKEIEENIIGNLSAKNCTTVLNKIRKIWTGDYSFRIECNNHLKYTFKEKVKIKVQDSPPSPQVTINKDTVKEGDSVTLTCSAPAPCPSLPPTLSWTPSLNDSVTVFQENDDHTKNVSSVMTFTASHLLHKQEVKCTAVYRLQADSSKRTSHTSVTLEVQYSPKNTSVLIRNWSLSCSSDANPAVSNYTWYKVTGREAKVVSHTQILTSNITELTDSGQLYCRAQNERGLQNSSIVQLHCESPKALPILIGAVAGAAGMMLMCIIMQIPLKKTRTREYHSSMIRGMGGLTLTNQTSQSENDSPVVQQSNTDHGRGTERGTAATEGDTQSSLYGKMLNCNLHHVPTGTDVMRDVPGEQEQCALGVMSGKRKKTRQPESGAVSRCGFRSQHCTETQKRKSELGVEPETMEGRESSVLDNQLCTPELKVEATYGNICHQQYTKGPDKRPATVEASVKDQQSHHAVAFHPPISEEMGSNESEYAVVRKKNRKTTPS